MEKTQLFTTYFLVRILIDTVSMIILVRFVYYNTYKKRDNFSTFFLLNFIVFLLSFMLGVSNVFIDIGGAFSLGAAFSLLRFRTETMSMKDMTYLFIIMTFGLINSMMKGSYLEIVCLNIIIIVVVFVVDGNQIMRNQQHKIIEYPSLQNILPDKQIHLIKELRERTGLDIQKISIESIDFGKERAVIKVYYYEA